MKGMGWNSIRKSKMGDALGRSERENPQVLTGETRSGNDGKPLPVLRASGLGVTLRARSRSIRRLEGLFLIPLRGVSQPTTVSNTEAGKGALRPL